jgi:cytochrome P450
MRPGTTGAFPKVVPPQGETVHGQFIPGGTVVAMNISSLLRSQEIFGDDPELYRPERWLEVDHAKRVEMEREVEMMFGNGRWMCAGKPIAFMELHKTFFEVSELVPLCMLYELTAMYQLFRYYDFQIAQPTKPWNSASYTVFIEQDMLLRVTKAVE